MIPTLSTAVALPGAPALPAFTPPLQTASLVHAVDVQEERRAESISQWREIMEESYGELDFIALQPDEFIAGLRSSNSPGFAVHSIRGRELQATRTRMQTRHSSTNQTIMIWQLSGECVASQAGERSLVRQGDIVFLDFDTPYTVDCATPFAQLVTQVSTDALSNHPSFGGRTAALHAVQASPASQLDLAPWAALLWELFRQSILTPDARLSPAMRASAIDAISNLASSAASKRQTRVRPGDGLLQRALATIDARCHDQELSADSIASELHVSRRTLFRLFEGSNISLEDRIQEARLQRAVALLEERPFRLTIEAVAYLSGFKSASHFHARFLERFACTPASFRDGSAG